MSRTIFVGARYSRAVKTKQIAACKRPAWLLLMKWFVLILGKETNTSKLEARRNSTFNEY